MTAQGNRFAGYVVFVVSLALVATALAQVNIRKQDRDRTSEPKGTVARKELQSKTGITKLFASPVLETKLAEPVDALACRLPDLRVGRWWYRPAPRVGAEVDLFFEVENVGCRAAPGPILWEVTNHNWGFWNPVLNRMAVSYSRWWLFPGQTRIVHIRFRMTQEMHNLRLMADPSDHLGPPDNPPFGQKALLNGRWDLRNGHILESNERNNAKWACIKIFSITPGEIARIAIPIHNPFPGHDTEVLIEMDKELAIPQPYVVGLRSLNPILTAANAEPIIEPVKPGQVIAAFTFGPDNDEEVVVLLATVVADAVPARAMRFKVHGAAVGPDGEPIFATVNVVLEVEGQASNAADLLMDEGPFN